MINVTPPPRISTDRFDKDAITAIMDDGEAMKIFIELGILDQLTPPNPDHKKAYMAFQSDHHYGIAQYFRGFAKPSDNGYAVTLFPKNLFTKEHVAQFLGDCISLDGGQPVFVDLGPGNKTNN